MYERIRVVAMDLDGTLTQHKEPLTPQNRAALDALARRYTLVMVGAGQAMRIFRQLQGYPIDVIGNYGMQYGRYEAGGLRILRDEQLPCDREAVTQRIAALRSRFGFTEFAGESVEFHPSGCITFPILGTKACQPDKLAFDPDRSRRRAIYSQVVEAFPEYCVFVGGSSSFDMAPRPFNKYHALDLYCRERGLGHENVVYIGDDYGPGGNDEAVFQSDFACIPMEDYRRFPEKIAPLLGEAMKEERELEL